MTDPSTLWAETDYDDVGDDGWEVHPQTPRNRQPSFSALNASSAGVGAHMLEGLLSTCQKESLKDIPPAEVPDHIGRIFPFTPHFGLNCKGDWRPRAKVPMDVQLSKHQIGLAGVRVLPMEYSWSGEKRAAATCCRLTNVMTGEDGVAEFVCVGAAHSFEDNEKGTAFGHILVESDRQIFAPPSADIRFDDEEHAVTLLGLGWPEGVDAKKIVGSPPEKPQRGQSQAELPTSSASRKEMTPDIAFFKVECPPSNRAWPRIEQRAQCSGPHDWYPVPSDEVPSAGAFQDVDQPVACVQIPGAYRAADFVSDHDVQDLEVAAAMAEASHNSTHRVGYQGASAGIITANDGYHLKGTYSSCHGSSGSPVLLLKKSTSLVGVHAAGRAFVNQGSAANIATSVHHPAFVAGYVRHVLPFHMALHKREQLVWPQPHMLSTLKSYLEVHNKLLKKAGLWETKVAPFLKQAQP